MFLAAEPQCCSNTGRRGAEGGSKDQEMNQYHPYRLKKDGMQRFIQLIHPEILKSEVIDTQTYDNRCDNDHLV